MKIICKKDHYKNCINTFLYKKRYHYLWVRVITKIVYPNICLHFHMFEQWFDSCSIKTNDDSVSFRVNFVVMVTALADAPLSGSHYRFGLHQLFRWCFLIFPYNFLLYIFWVLFPFFMYSKNCLLCKMCWCILRFLFCYSCLYI